MLYSRQLELFLAVLDSPSMTSAAESLHLSTAAVSLQLRTLAEELQTDLFVRAGRRLMPTLAARRLETRARRIVEELHAISADFQNRAEQDRQPFWIASGATTLLYSLRESFRLLRAQYPYVDLHVSVLPTENIVVGLQKRKLDIGIISLPYECPELYVVPLFEEELLLVRPACARSSNTVIGSVHAETLNGQPFLLYPEHSNMRALINRFCDSLEIKPRVIMEAEDTEVIKRMVEEGFGFSFLPESAIRKIPGRFEILRVAEGSLARRQALATCRAGHSRALTRLLADFLCSALRSTRRPMHTAGHCIY